MQEAGDPNPPQRGCNRFVREIPLPPSLLYQSLASLTTQRKERTFSLLHLHLSLHCDPISPTLVSQQDFRYCLQGE